MDYGAVPLANVELGGNEGLHEALFFERHPRLSSCLAGAARYDSQSVISVVPPRRDSRSIFFAPAAKKIGSVFASALLTLYIVWFAPEIVAQQPAPAAPAASPGEAPGLSEVYTKGMAAFQSGDYATAIANLKTVLEQAAAPEAQLEPVMFTLGAAYVNAKDYPNAIATFLKFQTKYPKSTRQAEVTFALAQAQMLGGDAKAAAATIRALESNPQFHDQAGLLHASAAKAAGNLDEAITALVNLIGKDVSSVASAKAAFMLASIYVEKGETAKAAELLLKLQKHVEFVENIVGLNSLAVDLGDKLLQQKNYAAALGCYRTVRFKDEVIRIQNERIVAMQKQIDANLAAVRANPAQAVQLLSRNDPIRTEMESAKKLLEEFAKLPSFRAPLYMRMARCFYDDGKAWEAIVVYEELMLQSTDPKEREPALYALLVTYSEVDQSKVAQDYCETYLKEFPEGPNAATVGYLRGAMALQGGDYKNAETWFGNILEKQPQGPMSEQIRLLLGNSKFSQGKFDEAIAEYKKYESSFPNGALREEVEYRRAIAYVFSSKYEEAFAALGEYLKKYPRGNFSPDAKYRLAVCKLAAQQFDEVISDCLAWEKEFSGNDQLGEVLALLGDAYVGNDDQDKAFEAYSRSYKKAVTPEVLNYSLLEASKILQKKGEWDKVAKMFEDFVKEKPDDPAAVVALFWIGKAKARLGQVDEAKQFLATTIKKYIDDPTKDAVEQMISQLVQLCVKKKKPVVVEEGAVAAASPAATPAARETDAGAEIDSLLGDAGNAPAARARVLFTKAELARLRKQPADEDKNLKLIADTAKPEDLSAAILGRVGDYLLAKNDFERASKFYHELIEEFPKSDVVDYAYAGLGEIAFQKKDYQNALKYFGDGTDKIAASQKVKEVTLGKARALLALDKLDDAKKVFEQVASIREWRGEATAASVFSLGEIELKQGKVAEANAYFQRVFVAYQKFLPWTAKAYIKSGECFEKLGKKQEAINTYNELLRQEKLTTFPETAAARKRLQELGQG